MTSTYQEPDRYNCIGLGKRRQKNKKSFELNLGYISGKQLEGNDKLNEKLMLGLITCTESQRAHYKIKILLLS